MTVVRWSWLGDRSRSTLANTVRRRGRATSSSSPHPSTSHLARLPTPPAGIPTTVGEDLLKPLLATRDHSLAHTACRRRRAAATSLRRRRHQRAPSSPPPPCGFSAPARPSVHTTGHPHRPPPACRRHRRIHHRSTDRPRRRRRRPMRRARLWPALPARSPTSNGAIPTAAPAPAPSATPTDTPADHARDGARRTHRPVRAAKLRRATWHHDQPHVASQRPPGRGEPSSRVTDPLTLQSQMRDPLTATAPCQFLDSRQVCRRTSSQPCVTSTGARCFPPRRPALAAPDRPRRRPCACLAGLAQELGAEVELCRRRSSFGGTSNGSGLSRGPTARCHVVSSCAGRRCRCHDGQTKGQAYGYPSR